MTADATDVRIQLLENEVQNLRALVNSFLSGGIEDQLSGTGFQNFGAHKGRLGNYGIQLDAPYGPGTNKIGIWGTDTATYRGFPPDPSTLSQRAAIFFTDDESVPLSSILGEARSINAPRSRALFVANANGTLVYGNFFAESAGTTVADVSFGNSAAGGTSGGIDVLTGGLSFRSYTTEVLAANTNNWAPTDAGTRFWFRISSSVGNLNLTGLTTGWDGRLVVIHNVDTVDTITLTDEDVLSTAANRFALPAALALPPDGCAILRYDGTSQRWRCLGAFTGASGVASTTTKYAPILMLAGM